MKKLLPLAAMIKHGKDVQKWTIQYLNPGQIPVTTFDQPLFAILSTALFTFVPVNHKHCLYSMHSQVVALLHHSGVEARSQPGIHGRPVMELQERSYIWQ